MSAPADDPHDDSELAPPSAAEPPIVEWYRCDPMPGLKRALGRGALVVALGAVVVAAGLAWSRSAMPRPSRDAHAAMIVADPMSPIGAGSHLPPSDPVASSLGLVGLGCLLLGTISAWWGLRKELASEHYLALRPDGAVFVTDDVERFVAWDDLADVEWDRATDALVFVPHGGEPVRLVAKFADIANEELARRVRALRRRALFGLVRSS